MRTIAETIDALMEGDVLRAGDLLIQRFNGNFRPRRHLVAARHHELTPEEGVGLASAADRQAISRVELQRRRLTDMISKK